MCGVFAPTRGQVRSSKATAMLVAGMTAGSHSLADVLLGGGVLLLFAGVVARACAARFARDRRGPGRPWRAPVGRFGPPRMIDAPAADAETVTGAPDPPLPQPLEPPAAARTAGGLDPLARLIDRSRRLNAAEDRVAAALAMLPDEAWLVERGVRLDELRISFLAIGPPGLFVICTSDGAWTLRDLHALSEVGERIRRRLAGHGGEPHAVMCLAFDDVPPRAWYGGRELQGRGGWVVGASRLTPWMSALGPADGLLPGEVRRLDERSGPVWERRATARLPAEPKRG
jgi:hypothetical protein